MLDTCLSTSQTTSQRTVITQLGRNPGCSLGCTRIRPSIIVLTSLIKLAADCWRNAFERIVGRASMTDLCSHNLSDCLRYGTSNSPGLLSVLVGQLSEFWLPGVPVRVILGLRMLRVKKYRLQMLFKIALNMEILEMNQAYIENKFTQEC